MFRFPLITFVICVLISVLPFNLIVEQVFAQEALKAVTYDWKIGTDHEFDINYTEKVDGRTYRTEGVLKFSVQRRNVTKGFDGKPLVDDSAESSTASAFLVSKEGHLLTCEHCVRHAQDVRVTLYGKSRDAKVVDVDEVHDLALLQIDDAAVETEISKRWSPLGLGGSQHVKLAQDVRAIGFPLSDLLGSSVKITRGGIAGFVGDGASDKSLPDLYQVDAAVNPGNSGGPLVDGFGNAIGVVNAKLNSERIDQVGFAIPIRFAIEFLKKNEVKFVAGNASVTLAGPDLAEKVTPAVAFVETKVDPDKSDFLLIDVQGELDADGDRDIVDTQIVVSSVGEIVDQKDAPVFAGMCCSVATLPFVKLPEVRLKKWHQRRLLAFEFNERPLLGRSDPFGMMHPFGGFDGWRMHFDAFGRPVPRSRGRGSKKVIYSKYQQFTADDQNAAELFEIKEKSKMQPFLDDEESSFNIEQSYESNWAFDSKDGTLQARTVNGSMEGNNPLGESVEIPFELALKRLTTRGIKSIAVGQTEEKVKQKAKVKAFNDLPSERLDLLTDRQLTDFIERGKSLDRATRLKYLNRLARWKQVKRSPEVVDALVSLTKNEDRTVRKAAIEALLNWSPKSATESVIRELRLANVFSKRSWIIKLGKTRSVEAARELCELLFDRRTRSSASAALAKLGHVAEPALVEFVLTRWKESSVTSASSDAGRALASALELLDAVITSESKERLQIETRDQPGVRELQATLDDLLKYGK